MSGCSSKVVIYKSGEIMIYYVLCKHRLHFLFPHHQMLSLNSVKIESTADDSLNLYWPFTKAKVWYNSPIYWLSAGKKTMGIRLMSLTIDCSLIGKWVKLVSY